MNEYVDMAMEVGVGNVMYRWCIMNSCTGCTYIPQVIAAKEARASLPYFGPGGGGWAGLQEHAKVMHLLMCMGASMGVGVGGGIGVAWVRALEYAHWRGQVCAFIWARGCECKAGRMWAWIWACAFIWV